MFKRKNLKWTIPVGVAVVVCVAGAYVALMAGARAQTAPPPLSPAQIIQAMQARANSLGALSGVLGMQVIAPAQEAWKGVPFLYKSPDRYLRQDGYAVSSLAETPAKRDDSWTMFKSGHVYVRGKELHLVGEGKGTSWTEKPPTLVAKPGEVVEARAFGCDVDALLLVNLMPQAWFAPHMADLTAGAIEDVGGRSFYTVIEDGKAVHGDNQLVRWPGLLQNRTPLKYYVNAESFICERMVWGAADDPDAFGASQRDIVASDLQQAGGSPLPLTYTLRFHGPSGVHFALQAKLENLNVMGGDAVGEGSFDAQALSAVVLQATEGPDELQDYVAGKPNDASAWLSLADAYNRTLQAYKARDALQKATELAGEQPTAEFRLASALLWHDLKYKVVRKQLEDAPQFERIYAERAERLRERGDQRHAADMDAKAGQWRQVKEDALARAAALNMKVK
jgi:hypothetical protein